MDAIVAADFSPRNDKTQAKACGYNYTIKNVVKSRLLQNV